MSRHDKRPAFPSLFNNFYDRNEQAPDGQLVAPRTSVQMIGMTIRQLYAGQAMQGYIAASSNCTACGPLEPPEFASAIGRDCWIMADALIATEHDAAAPAAAPAAPVGRQQAIEIARLYAALAPFADVAELFDAENRGDDMPGADSDPIMQWPRLHKDYELTVGHLRAAREAMNFEQLARSIDYSLKKGDLVYSAQWRDGLEPIEVVDINWFTRSGAFKIGSTSIIVWPIEGTRRTPFAKHELGSAS